MDYQLSDQPVFGQWKIRVIAQGQIEESTFLVEEYYQTRFEVNVTMPAFFLSTDEYIHGVVMANYTSGGPVNGNLTLKATVRPIRPIDLNRMINKTRVRPEDQYSYDRNIYGPTNYNQNYDQNFNRDQNYGNQNYDRNPQYYGRHTNQFGYNNGYDDYNRPLLEKYLNFNEEYPFWMKIADENYYEAIPSLKLFDGVYAFRYPIKELINHLPTLDGMEIVITATVGDRFLDEIIEGFSTARISNSSIKLKFLGDSPQVFKPGMPVTAYIVASFHDGSPLTTEILRRGRLEVSTNIDLRTGGRRDIPIRQIYQMEENNGIWEYKIDLKRELGVTGPKAYEELSQLSSLRVTATFRDEFGGDQATTELLMLAHYSVNDQHIKVITSTITPRVGEYMIFHIRSNYFIEKFNYLIIAKGIVLLTGDQDMNDFVSTMSIALSAEMAPVATMVVWHIGKYGELTVDSLTFPVNGISRNKVGYRLYIMNSNIKYLFFAVQGVYKQ